MNREAKISILKGIKSGVIPLDYLEEPKTFVFTQNNDKPGYEMNGEEYTEEDYITFCNKIDEKNKLLRTLGYKAEEDKIITVVYVTGKTIL